MILAINVFSQCYNCGSQYPSATQSITCGSSMTVTTCAFGGEYSVYNVVAGNTYTWSTCGDSDFDTQLTLFQGSCGSGTVLAYNDDGCGLQSTITWTATFTGTVSLLLSKYNCTTQSTCMTINWSCSGSGGGGGGGGTSCPGAPSCASSPPASDFCTSPTPICEFEGYCGNTSATYTPGEIPSQFCGSVENNSWISFVASSTSATLNVYVCNCTYSWGIQMQIYSTTNCATFTSYSNCWNPGVMQNGTVTATGLTPGNTYLLMIDGYAGDVCDYTISAASGVWMANAIVTETGTNTATICAGQSVHLQASGGTSYSWTPTTGLSNPNIANPIASPTTTTTYTCNVTGGNPLCPGTQQVQVTINVTPGLNITTSSTNPTCYGGNNGTASVTSVTGGTTPYTYQWSNGATSQNITGLSAGTYTVTVTSANGCTASATVTITNPPQMTVSATSTPANCGSNSGTVTANVTNGIPNFTYTLTPPGTSQNTSSTSFTFNNVASGSYTVLVTASNGCTATTPVTVGSTGSVNAGFTYNGNQCITGNSFNFTNTGTTGSGVTYLWTFPSGTPSSSTAENPTGITWTTPGTYTVTQTVTLGTCNATYSQNITVYPNPTANITPTNVTCFGICNGSAVATGSGGSGTYSYSWSTGANTQSITSLCPGSYTVTVTDTYGCKGTASINITQPAALNLTTTRTNPTCNGLCNGTANVTVSGGIGPFSYLWSNGATTASITGLCAGTYTVTVTDMASPGCTQTANVNLTDPPPMSLSTSKVDATCGMSNGSATVTVTAGGSPNYNYQWSNGVVSNNNPSNTHTISGLSAGSYTVTVTNSNGCTQTATINVGSTGAPTATIISSTNPLCNGTCNGSATVSIGGTLNPPYNYVWSNGSSIMGTTSTTNSVNTLCAGTSTVTITDNLGCQAVASINLSSPPALNVATSSINANCGQSNGSATANPTGGTPGYTYQWSPSTGNQTTQTATNLAPGSYSVTVYDANNCSQTATVNVGNSAGVTASIASQTNVSCNGGNNGTATAIGTGGTLPYSYQWPSSAGNQTTATATSLSAGTYTVTVTDANNCTSTASVTITQPSAVTASISTFTNTPCYGTCSGTATVLGGGGTPPFTYQWSNTQTSQTATGLCNGTYFVTVRDANNCSAVTSVTITQPTLLSATTSSTNAYCNQNNGSATANPTGGTLPYTYIWSNGQSTQTIINSTPGSYTVTVTDANGCTTIANTIIGNTPGGTATIASLTNTSCNGICDGSASVSMGGGTPPFTYLWSNGANTANVSGLCEAIYTVTVTDAGGCTSTAIADIKSPFPLVLSFNVNDVFCFNQCTGEISVTPSGGTSPYTYTWSTGSSQPTINNLCSGNYSVTVLDANNCSATGNRSISNIPPIILSATTTSSNCNQSNGSINLSITNGAAPFTFNWSNGANTEDLVNIPAGVYNVTVTDIKGCSATGSYTVTDISAPNATISTFTNVSCNGICNGMATGIASGGVLPYTYSWSNGNNSQTATNLCAGVYVFSVTDAAGCISTANVTITQPPVLQINSITSTNPNCNGDCNGTASVIVSGGTPPYTYQWTGGTPYGGQNPNNSTTTGICNGILTVTVTDNNGCTTSANTTVVEPSLLSLVPNSTPIQCAGQNTGSASVSITGGTPPYSYQWSANTGGQTSAVATNLGAGTYSVTVTDAKGCTESIPVTVTGPSPLIFSNITSTDLPCFQSNNGTVSVNVSGGTPPYSYYWTNTTNSYSSTNQNIGNLSADTYFLTVTDANGCIITTNVIINQPPQLTLNLFKTDETCYQFCNGSINAFPSGGQIPYTYLWSNAQNTSSVQNLCPGNYSVTITDNNGCTISGNITIYGPPLLQIDVVNVVPATCGQSNGEATISFQGGTTGYTIQWSTGGNSVHETNMPAGNHTVTLIDNNGCIATQQISIQNLNGPSITSINSSDVSCYGYSNGVAIVTYNPSNPPAPPYLTTWSNGMTGDTITGLSGGIYYVTVQDANGCISAGNIIIQEPTPLSSVVSSTTHNLCHGQCMGTASILAGGGTPPYTYSWLGIGQSEPTATNLCAGTYNVVVADQNACTTSNTVVINEPDEITIQGNISNVLCSNTSTGIISILATGGTPVYQYFWLPPVNSTTSVASNLPAGTYTVVVTDSWNCTSSANFVVTEPSPIEIYVSTQSAHCGLNNGTATIDSILGGTPGFSYLWSPGNMNTTTVTDLSSGIYQLIVTDANNCTIVQQVPIGQILGPDMIQLTKTDVSCYGYFDGTATANPVGGQPPYQFLWNNGQNTATAVNLGAGIYTVTVTDANGCTKANSVQISQPNPIIPIANGSDTICVGNFSVNITANAIGGTPPYTFIWSGPGLSNPNSQVQLVSPDTTSNYFVNVYDANGCASANPASVTVYVYPPITASISNDVIICKGDFYSINVLALGGKPPYTYVWNNGMGNPNVVSPTNTTTYIVSVYDVCGTPPAIDSMTITVKDPPHIIRDPRFQKGCVPLDVDFDCLIDPFSYPVTYSWNFGDPSSGVFNYSNDSTPSHTYSVPGNYNVTLTVTSSFGCQTTLTYYNLVQVSPYPQVDFSFNPTSNITPVNGDVWFYAQTDPNNLLTWIFGDGYTVSGTINPMHTYTQAGSYTVMLIARNADGCLDTAVHMLRVNEIFTLWAPSAFSPGSGKANGYWYPRGLGIDSSNYYLAIYDRWGQIIFETREMPKGTNLSPSEVITLSIANNEWEPGGWNGGYMNDMTKIVPAGSYIWYIKVKEKDTGYIHEKKGIVTVIR